MNTAKQDKILMVDDEPNVLSGYQRTVGRSHPLTIAEGAAAGLAAIQSAGPFAVVITDMRMPEMTGLEFIASARASAKESVFMMLTGNADQQTAVDAINCGQIFRFLNKPCSPQQLDQAIRAGLRQYELVTAERILLRDTLTGTIKLLADALEMANPFLASIQTTVKKFHLELCTALGIARDWQMSVAAALCLIGLVTVPGLKKEAGLTDEALELAATLGHRLITKLPRLSPVAEMILHQRDPGPLPLDFKSPPPQMTELIGARLLRICVDLALEQSRSGSITAALGNLKSSGSYDKRLISALESSTRTESAGAVWVVKKLAIQDLEAGMEIETDIVTSDGKLILSRGQQLSEIGVACLRNHASRGTIGDAVHARVMVPKPAFHQKPGEP
jgi:response regulator RpfG family c-di-GMP phosphodiesterase